MTRKRELPRSSQSDARIFAAIERIKQTQTHFRGLVCFSSASTLNLEPPDLPSK